MKEKRSTPRSIPSSVREFYNVFPFPGYSLGDYESVSSLYTRASPYAHLLNKEIPPNVRVLDAGCGTGQFAAFLSMQNRKVVGIDFSEASVAQAKALKEKLDLRNVEFTGGDIFALNLPSESFDYVFCNGVLHHTQDPYGGFKALVGLVKPGGFIIIGLYNRYGRLFTKMRQILFRIIGRPVTRLDYFLRRSANSPKGRIWYADQYIHPHESTHTVDEVLRWFRLHKIEYVRSIPNIRLFAEPPSETRIFGEAISPGPWLEHFLSQTSWILTGIREGGYFITIGRKERRS